MKKNIKSITSMIVCPLILIQYLSAKYEIDLNKEVYPQSRYGLEYRTSFYDNENFNIGINTIMYMFDQVNFKDVYNINKTDIFDGLGFGIYSKFNILKNMWLDINTSIVFTNFAYQRTSLGIYFNFLDNLSFFIKEYYNLGDEYDFGYDRFNTSIGVSYSGEIKVSIR